MYLTNDTEPEKLRKVYRGNARIRRDICASIPAFLKVNDDDLCSKTLKIRRYRFGSLTVEQDIATSSASSSA